MNSDDRELFEELIVAAGKLATVSDNAGAILSEEFENMVAPSVIQVRAILARCPKPQTQWDGELRDDDIIVSRSEAPGPQGNKRWMVQLEHTITGITRSSYTKATEAENHAVARKALAEAVAQRYL